MPSSPVAFLKSRTVQVASVLLVAQAIGVYAISRAELIPLARPLADFPSQLSGWTMVQEGVVEKETADVLQADDLLTRTYAQANTGAANLFVAYFKSQRTGKAPHSPKNCLPGSGWSPLDSRIVQVAVPAAGRSIEVNRYVVVKGDERSVVMYWYQARNRVVASEYRARAYMIADSIRYNRTDTALVRIVVPVQGGDTQRAIRTAEAFVGAAFPALFAYLPS